MESKKKGPNFNNNKQQKKETREWRLGKKPGKNPVQLGKVIGGASVAFGLERPSWLANETRGRGSPTRLNYANARRIAYANEVRLGHGRPVAKATALRHPLWAPRMTHSSFRSQNSVTLPSFVALSDSSRSCSTRRSFLLFRVAFCFGVRVAFLTDARIGIVCKWGESTTNKGNGRMQMRRWRHPADQSRPMTESSPRQPTEFHLFLYSF